jgi:hypothetical protein
MHIILTVAISLIFLNNQGGNENLMPVEKKHYMTMTLLRMKEFEHVR